MELVFSKNAQKTLVSLDKATAVRILNGIEHLLESPMYGDIKALKGSLKGSYRLRIGTYRIIFSVKETIISIESIILRKDAYRGV